VSRFLAEILVAALTAIAGVTVVFGALEFGISWGAGGPQPGTFPFYVGLVIVAASVGNFVQVLLRTDRSAVFVDAPHMRRVAAFFVPIVLFVALTMLVGLYVASALYLGSVMYVQGRYRIATALVVAIGTASFFYVVLELWFKVPLLKGPLEHALGLY
jgi:hypothetical protein